MSLFIDYICYLAGVHAAGTGVENFFVTAPLAVNFLWRTALCYAALLQNIDAVSIDNLADVVRDDDDKYGANLFEETFQSGKEVALFACRQL